MLYRVNTEREDTGRGKDVYIYICMSMHLSIRMYVVSGEHREGRYR